MTYSKEKLILQLDKLKGKNITNCFYFSASETKETVSDFHEIPTLGLLIEIDFLEYFTVVSTDYFPYSGFGGLDLFENPFSNESNRPSHLDDLSWNAYINKRIVGYQIIENTYIKERENFVVPFGIKLEFEQSNELFMLDLGAEDYSGNNDLLKVYRGGGVVLFFNKTLLQKLHVLDDCVFRL